MNVIITGASRGIGHATARRFLSAGGYRLGVVARSEDPLLQLQEACTPGSTVIPYVFDLATGETEALAQAIRRDFDRVDILINNAGYLVKKPFSGLERDDYLQSMEVNFLAPLFLIRHLLPLLERSEVKHVVNITSMAGFQSITKVPGLAAYSASKAALNNLTELLAVEMEETGLRINALAPGTVDTEMLRKAMPGYRAGVSPPEMAEYIFSFATTAWQVMNGKVIPVALTTT